MTYNVISVVLRNYTITRRWSTIKTGAIVAQRPQRIVFDAFGITGKVGILEKILHFVENMRRDLGFSRVEALASLYQM
jgi:hypothetical protein